MFIKLLLGLMIAGGASFLFSGGEMAIDTVLDSSSRVSADANPNQFLQEDAKVDANTTLTGTVGQNSTAEDDEEGVEASGSIKGDVSADITTDTRIAVEEDDDEAMGGAGATTDANIGAELSGETDHGSAGFATELKAAIEAGIDKLF